MTKTPKNLRDDWAERNARFVRPNRFSQVAGSFGLSALLFAVLSWEEASLTQQLFELEIFASQQGEGLVVATHYAFT